MFLDSEDKRKCKNLESVLKPVVVERPLEVFTKFEDFAMRIRRLPRDVDVAVLWVRSDRQLTALLYLAEYLEGARIILILNNRDQGMTRKAHLLHPRFLTYIDDDFSNIAAVLSKMLQKNNCFSIKAHS